LEGDGCKYVIAEKDGNTAFKEQDQQNGSPRDVTSIQHVENPRELKQSRGRRREKEDWRRMYETKFV
jgi:hypothetical protein